MSVLTFEFQLCEAAKAKESNHIVVVVILPGKQASESTSKIINASEIIVLAL